MPNKLAVDKSPAVWFLGTLAFVVAATALVVFDPLVAAAVLVVGVFLWSFAWKVERFFAAHFALAVFVLMAVPILRLTQAENVLRIAVPAVLVATSLAVAVRVRAAPVKGIIPLMAVYFFLGFVATSMATDSNEWSFFALEVLVAGAAFIFAKAAAQIQAWPTIARVIILATAAEAALGIYEVFRLSAPIWRGARILPDGSSVWIRNEVIASIPRAQGTFGHPLPFAFTLILGALLLLRTKVWPGAVRLVIFALLGAGVVVSGSRNAIILFAVLSLLALVLPSLLTRLPLVGTVAFAGLVLAFPFLLEKFDDLVDSGSVGHRLGALSSITNLMTERSLTAVMLGDGSASAPRLFSQNLLQTDGFAAVDNQYVLTLAQNGVLGLLVFIIIMIVALRRASATLRVLILAVVITGMIFDLFTWPVIGFFVWFLIASSFANMPGTNPPARRPKESPERISRMIQNSEGTSKPRSLVGAR